MSCLLLTLPELKITKEGFVIEVQDNMFLPEVLVRDFYGHLADQVRRLLKIHCVLIYLFTLTHTNIIYVYSITVFAISLDFIIE